MDATRKFELTDVDLRDGVPIVTAVMDAIEALVIVLDTEARIVLSSGQFPGKHENYWVTKDGRRRFIRWSNSAVLDGSGSVKYIIGTGFDITEFRTEHTKDKSPSPA
jgi:PAS domain-containing protein